MSSSERKSAVTRHRDKDTYLAIVNPVAGGKRCGRRARQAIQGLREGGLSIDVKETRAEGDAVTLARHAYREGRRLFIAVGGDGTIHEIINGLFPNAAESGRVTLGFLPLGSGNSFLRDFSDKGTDYAVESLLEGRRRSSDLLRLTHRNPETQTTYFINIMSLGFAAEVNASRKQHFSSFGELGYVMAVLTKLVGLSAQIFPISLDGGNQQHEPATFISINNSKYTGGTMMMAPDADTADGKGDLIYVGAMSRLKLLNTFPKIFSGKHVTNPAVSTRKFETIEFDFPQPVKVMIDGEAMQTDPTRVDVLPGALDVVV